MASDDFRALVQSVGGWDGFEIAAWRTEDTLEPDAFGLPAKRAQQPNLALGKPL